MSDTWRVPGYTEVDVLGTGGFGRVVLAKHEASGQLTAIKYLQPDLLADARIVDGFRREAWLLSGVRSPHVVRLFDFVETPHGAALVMEAVPGVSLRALLATENVLAPESALAILKGSLLGLAGAHAAGVVHRDYKPGNVLVSREGESKLVDFGLATLAGHSGLTAGSPSYMAPEQWSGQPGRPATDVYAATCVFYESITGHRPFEADTTQELRSMHERAPVPLDTVPEALRPLIARGMAKDPAWRPSTADAFVTELETVARKAYGRNWEKRGWKRLATSVAALTALTPLALLTGAGTAAAPVAAGAVAAGVPATGTGTGVTAVIIGKIAAAIVVVGALVTGGILIFGNKSDPPPPAPLTVAVKTLAGQEQALPLKYDLQYPEVAGGADPAARQRINAALRAPIDKRLKTIRDAVANPDWSPRFTETAETAVARSTARVLLQTPTLLSVRYDHDLDSSVLSHTTWRFPETVNVDLVTGQVLGPKDMFRPEVLTATGMRTLTQLLEPHTRNGFCRTPAVTGVGRKVTIDAADRTSGGEHVPGAAIGFTAAGAEFEILWYDLGCDTASGKETVTLPYAEIGNLLLPRFLASLGQTGSSTPSSAPSTAPPSTPSSSVPASGETTYTNQRFGFSAHVPAGYVATPYTPEKGDGMTFTNADLDATLTVWGANTGGQRTSETLAGVVARAEAAGGKVTYRKDEGDHYSVSGYLSDGKIFYERGYPGSKSKAVLRWVYPREHKAELDAPVSASLDTFRPGDVSQPH
ncbi:protein kinase domain-containing protein [Amycolatopsis jejuensis]|uniref:protein kinase domain-containing protein n=1 Tax=Amycolatopsis jejuensis TaxID=330084 RepID=UPI00068E7FB7|nr:protein kinase [Amycolatopsis jejuensis]